MKHTYENPVITVDAGMAEGVYAASGAPTTQIRKCSLLKQIIFLRQHPIPMLPLLCLFFYSFPSSALFLSSFFFFFTTRSLRKNALSISEHSSFSTPRSTFT